MSVQGESRQVGDLPSEAPVDPADVDWDAIREEWADDDGLLTVSERTDAISQTVPEVTQATEATAVLSNAIEAGYIEERGEDYYIPGGESDDTLDATDVDWESLFEAVTDGGTVTEPLPDASKRAIPIQLELGLEKIDDANALVEDARERGIIVNTEVNGTKGLYYSDAIGNVPEPDPEPAVETESDSEPDPDPETEPDPVTESVTETESKPAPEDMSRGDLEQEVRDLRSTVEDMDRRLEAHSARMDALTKAVFGQDSIPGDVNKSESVLTKFVDLNDRVDEHDEKLTMVSTNSGSRSTPDERGMALRAALYEEAKQSAEKKAVMDRDQVKYALGGGLSRAQLLDAMRRAADGRDADINGSSDLEPVNGLEFVKGTGRSTQSKIRLNLTETSGENLRKNLTTKHSGQGGS